ncbi:MAG TPA: hypothetical protein VGM44_12930 [Polyangiaceae bacterium]|jgi:hypothetical protein
MLRRHRRILAWSLGSALAALWASGCSLQNFDYLKGEYRGSAGSTSGNGGSSAQGGGAGGTDAVAGSSMSGAGNAGGAHGGSSGIAGTSGDDGVGGDMTEIDGGDGGPPLPGQLLNPGFETAGSLRTDTPDWTSTGDTDAAYIDHSPVKSGANKLGHWLGTLNDVTPPTFAYQVSTFQTVSPLPDGTYTFKIWVDRSAGLISEYIFAKDYAKGQPAAQIKVDTATAIENVYTQFVIPNIQVTSGKCTLGIFTQGPNDMANNWANIDDAEFELAGEAGASGT